MVRAMVKSRSFIGPAVLALSLGALAGCEEGKGPAFLQPKDKSTTAASAPGKAVTERDVEAPEVFQASEAGLWDGRPSLGGIWVAHPDVTDPERVIIRNSANDKFVVGALFRRERDIPGPRIQASSDAAASLGMLAGAPVELTVTALRKEVIEEEPTPEGEEVIAVDEVDEITETELDPIAGAAAAAIDATAPEAAPAPTPAAAKPQSTATGGSYVQIGIFGVKGNAERAAQQMRSAGMVPTVLEESTSGKTFWRVVVGPAQSRSESTTLLNKVKETGFSDAYIVKR